MENHFYVYVLLDPRKKGDFKYGDYTFEYEPFYIGKGCKDRIQEHLRASYLKEKTYKNNKINKIILEGLNVISLKISENSFEVDAFELEKKLISIIGRSNLNLGPLTNLTNGGEGISGLIKTDTHKLNLSISSKGKKMSAEAKAKISESLRGKVGRNTGNKHSDYTKQKISNSKKGQLSWNAEPVLQLDENETILQEWISASAAAKELKLSQGNIWSVINGKRNKCGGFKWKLK